MFVFLVALGWTLIIIGAIVQIFVAILNLLIMQHVALPSILTSMNDIFQKSIFKQEQLLNNLTGDTWAYTINALTIFVALLVIVLVSFQLHRVRKGQLIPKPYLKMFFVTLIIAALIYGKVAVLILAALMFIGLLFIESSLFDVSSLQNFVEERNMIIIYRQEKKLEREVNKEGKYHGSVTLGVDATTAGIAATERNFKDNDYVKEDDNKKLSKQKAPSMFPKNELNNLFNSNKNDIDENELANLINDMTQTTTSSQKEPVVHPKKELPLTKPKQNNKEFKAKPASVNENNQAEILHPTIEKPLATKASAETKIKLTKPVEASSAIAETIVDKKSNLNDDNVRDESNSKELNPSFLEDELLNFSWAAEKTMTKKEKKCYNKWSEMHQQALNVKAMVEEEIQTTEGPTRVLKKKVKIYNLIAKEANKLAKKLKLDADYDLELMHIAEIYSANAQATVDFFHNDSLDDLDANNKMNDEVMNDNINVDETLNKSISEIDPENDDLNDVVNNDEVKKEIETMNDDTTTGAKEGLQETGITFIPADHNIDKLKGELLPDIQTSDDTESDSDNVPAAYPFDELKGLDDLQNKIGDNFNNVQNDEFLEEKNNADITTGKLPDEGKSESEITAGGINLELTSEPLASPASQPVTGEPNDVTPVAEENAALEGLESLDRGEDSVGDVELVSEEVGPLALDAKPVAEENAALEALESLDRGEDLIADVELVSEEVGPLALDAKPVAEENAALEALESLDRGEDSVGDAELPFDSKSNKIELEQIKKEDDQGELLDDVVSSEIEQSFQPEFKPVLKDEVSYSLDELDDKIMSGDFSNLDDEVIEYLNQEQSDVINEPQDKKVIMVEQQEAPIEQNIPNDFEYRFEKIEELIKNSINLHTVHTKTLAEMQTYLKSLTLKIEELELKTNDFATKIKEIETKKDIKYHGVPPIDQFYPQINDINLASTRYNLYNKKGYSNRYGAVNSSDNSYGLGNYYRTKNSGFYQDDIATNNNQFVDYNHLNLHNISKYTKQDIPFEVNCPFCKKENK